MIVNSEDLVEDDLLNPIIGSHNVVGTSNVSATTEADGFPATNLANPATHLLWVSNTTSGDEYLTVAITGDDEIDYVAVARHNFGTALIVTSVEVATADSPSDWVEVIEPFLLADDGPVLFRFLPQVVASARLRLQQSGTSAEAAVLYVGKLLIPERSITVTQKHTPFNLGLVTKIVNGRSEGGNFLGRTIINSKSVSVADFEHFTPSWYRENFQPFVEEAQEHPFFFAWNPDEYPLELDYAWLTEDPKPEVDTVTRRVSVQLKMEGLAPRGTTAGSAAPATLPVGAIGLWYMDDYVASPRPLVPNDVASTAVSADLFNAPRRLFSNTTMWSGSPTIVDDAATAPDSSNEASTLVVGASNWTLAPQGTYNLPAGDYIVAINAKRNTGSDQFFAFSSNNTSTRSSIKTATSAWQRFSYTFTLGAPTTINSVVLCSSDGSTGADIQICDFELYSGSSDLGPQVLAGHLYWGVNAQDTRPAFLSGWVDMTNTGFGTIQLPANVSLSTFTAIATIAQVDRVGPAFQAFLSKCQGHATFSALLESNAIPEDEFGGGIIGYPVGLAGLWRLVLDDAHIIGFRYDGAIFSFWIDDLKLLQTASVVGAQTVRDFWVGLLLSTAFPSHYKVNSIGLWDRSLSDLEYRVAVESFSTRADLFSNITVQTASDRVYLAEGDSITATAGGTPYPSLFGPNANPPVIGVNASVNATGIADFVTRAATYDAIIPPDPEGRKFILSVLATNDAISASYLTDLAAYCDARRAAGWLVIVCTITPRTTGGFNTARNLLNPVLVTWVGLHADAICDFAADPTMGPDAAASNVALYVDGIHPSATGAAILETVIRPVINAL